VTTLSNVPADRAGHIATPAGGQSSWLRMDGGPAGPRLASHYPITTTCKICHLQIRLYRILQMEWSHPLLATCAPAPLAGDMP
jgi:hypothetical protein